MSKGRFLRPFCFLQPWIRVTLQRVLVPIIGHDPLTIQRQVEAFHQRNGREAGWHVRLERISGSTPLGGSLVPVAMNTRSVTLMYSQLSLGLPEPPTTHIVHVLHTVPYTGMRRYKERRAFSLRPALTKGGWPRGRKDNQPPADKNRCEYKMGADISL